MAIKRKRSRSMVRNASRKRARYSRRKRYMPRRNRRYLRSLLRYTETKWNDLNTAHDLYHNGGIGNTFVPDFNMCQTSVGTNQNTRIGDKVWAKGLKVKMWLSNKGDRPNVMYRIFAITMPPDQVNNSPAGLFSGTTTGNRILDFVNTDRYKVIYHKVITVQTTSKWTTPSVDKEVSRYHSFYIPMNRMISYTTDGGNVPKYQKDIIGFGYIVYDAFGTLTSDNIASIRVKTRFYFKDP